MSIRPILLFVGVLSVCAQRPLSASTPGRPIEPIRPWVLDDSHTQCFAERTYGSAADPIYLGIRASLTGDFYDLSIARRGRAARYSQQSEGAVDFGTGKLKIWLLQYGIPAKGLAVQKFRLSAADFEKAKTAPLASSEDKLGPDTTLALRDMSQVMAKLQRCTLKLREYWNMPGSARNQIAKLSRGNVRHLFASHLYPKEATLQLQGGTTQLLLLVDENGKVAGCDVVLASGFPIFEVMGCQILRDRAKFEPALDAQGRRVKSSIVTPPIIWRMGG